MKYKPNIEEQSEATEPENIQKNLYPSILPRKIYCNR